MEVGTRDMARRLSSRVPPQQHTTGSSVNSFTKRCVAEWKGEHNQQPGCSQSAPNTTQRAGFILVKYNREGETPAPTTAKWTE